MSLGIELDSSLGSLANHEEGGHGGRLGVSATAAAYSSRVQPRGHDLSDELITLRECKNTHAARKELAYTK